MMLRIFFFSLLAFSLFCNCVAGFNLYDQKKADETMRCEFPCEIHPLISAEELEEEQ